MGTWIGQIRTTFVFCRWKFIPFILLRGRTLGIFNYTVRYDERQLAFLKQKSDLGNVKALIEKEQPDVIVVNELIAEFHRDAFESFLQEKKFSTILWGVSKHYTGATVSTAVASKLPAAGFTVEVEQAAELSGGGGFAGIRLTNSPISIIGGHFTNSRRTLSRRQIEDVAKAAAVEMQNGRKIIIAGDFNEIERRVQRVPEFQKLNLKSSSREKTFPTMLPAPLRRDLDHIFVSNNMEISSSHTTPFGSDHLALVAETA